MIELLGMRVVLPEWLAVAASPLAAFAANVIAWVIIALLASWGLHLVTRRMAFFTRTHLDDTLLSIVRRPLVTLLLSHGVLVSWQAAYGESSFTGTLHRVYNGVLIILAAHVAWRILFEIVLAYLKPAVQDSDGQAGDILIPILGRIGPVIIVIAVANAVVSTLGGNLGTLLAGLGLLGLVLGYLFQEPLQGLFSGTYMSLDNPFRTDDLIMLEDGTTCQVRSVGVRVTQLYDVKHHVVLYLPNARLAANKITNLTKPSVELRSILNVTINKPCDLQTALALLVGACNSHENVLGDWSEKEPAIRRRLESYRQEQERLTALFPPTPDDLARAAWLQRHMVRLDGELIRLQVERFLRIRNEQFSRDLLGLTRYCSQLEQGGLNTEERERIKQRVLALMDQFDELVEQITVWLYLVKIIECELTDADYGASIASFVQRDLLRDGRLTLEELAQSQAPGAPTRRIVQREDLPTLRSSSVEADKAVGREQFRDRAHFVDYKRLYSIWHRNIALVYRGLDRLHRLDRLQSDREMSLDEELRRIERHFSDTFLLSVSYWQQPFASLVDATDTTLKFELAFFVDDVVREQFQRSQRVTTEVLAEIDRLRKTYYTACRDNSE